MAALFVKAGLHLNSALDQLVIVGRNKLLKSLKYEGDLAKKLTNIGVDNKIFNIGIERIESTSTLPIFFNSVKVI